MSVVCRICLDIAAKDSHSGYYSLNDATDSFAMMIKWKLEKCLPEFAVDAIKDSVICNSCADALHVAYKFRKKFMETEEKLREYLMEKNCDDDDPIDVSLLLKWLSKYDSYKKPNCAGHTRDEKNMNDCYMELTDIRAKTHRLTSDESYITPLVVNIKSEPINEPSTSPIAYNSALDQLRVEVDWNDKGAPKSPDCSSANQIYKSESSTLEKLLKAPISDMCISSDPYIHTNALKSDLEKEPPDFNDDHDMKDVSVKTEEPEWSSNMIISGLSCDYKHFLEFEEQFAGYTMDELYSKQLIALPECSVVIDRLSNKEIKRWTEGESDEEMQPEESNIPEETDPRRYKCYSCNYYAPQLEQFVEHMTNSIHQQKQKYFISKRRFTSSIIEESQDYWKSHVSAVKCSLCQFTTDDDNKFKKHLESHSLMYKCVECSYATTSTNNLKTHYIRNHCNTAAPFRCNKCKLFFSNRLVLINHMLTGCTKCKGDIYYEHNYAVV